MLSYLRDERIAAILGQFLNFRPYNGPDERARNGRGRIEETASYVEHVRAVLLRDGAVAPDSLLERTETRRKRAFRRSIPGLTDDPDQVAVVIEYLKGHAAVVAVLLPQVDEPVILRCPDAQRARDPKGGAGFKAQICS